MARVRPSCIVVANAEYCSDTHKAATVFCCGSKVRHIEKWQLYKGHEDQFVPVEGQPGLHYVWCYSRDLNRTGPINGAQAEARELLWWVYDAVEREDGAILYCPCGKGMHERDLAFHVESCRCHKAYMNSDAKFADILESMWNIILRQENGQESEAESFITLVPYSF